MSANIKDAMVKPKGLSKEASVVWDNLMSKVSRLAELRPEDHIAIIVLSEQLKLWVLSKSAVDKDGLFVKGRKDAIVKHPGATVMAQTTSEIRQLLKELGLTNSSRSRMSASERKALPTPESKNAVILDGDVLPDDFFDQK